VFGIYFETYEVTLRRYFVKKTRSNCSLWVKILTYVTYFPLVPVQDQNNTGIETIYSDLWIQTVARY